TGKFEREQQPLVKKLKLILLFNPLTEWIGTTHVMRLYLHKLALDEGKKEGTPESKKQIKKFIDTYHINMDDFEPSGPDKYRNSKDFFTRKHRPRSRRQYVVIETENFGELLSVAIGATDVGSVEIHDRFRTPGAQVKKGDELGIFQFGGLSIIVAFEKGRVEFDQDLLEMSKQRIQVAVEVGMSLGRALHG
ncbi:hypothetical protein C8A03DRAFT_17386, partial [Achaetomium macrosporum]